MNRFESWNVIACGFLHCLLVAIVFFFSPAAVAQTCLPENTAAFESVDIESVTDGDTLVLGDGRKVRLVGVNTPELARSDEWVQYPWQRIDQPLAQEAGDLLRKELAKGSVKLYPSVSGRDRYKRTLAHVFVDGRNVTAHLLRAGMGFAITLEPDVAFAECYQQAEISAREQGVGVWSMDAYRPIQAINFDDWGRTGFVLLRGIVTRVSSNSGRTWIDIDDTVVVAVSDRFVQAFGDVQSLHGVAVAVRGWVIDKKKKGRRLPPWKKRWLVSINHPAMLRREDDGN